MLLALYFHGRSIENTVRRQADREGSQTATLRSTASLWFDAAILQYYLYANACTGVEGRVVRAIYREFRIRFTATSGATNVYARASCIMHRRWDVNAKTPFAIEMGINSEMTTNFFKAKRLVKSLLYLAYFAFYEQNFLWDIMGFTLYIAHCCIYRNEIERLLDMYGAYKI